MRTAKLVRAPNLSLMKHNMICDFINRGVFSHMKAHEHAHGSVMCMLVFQREDWESILWDGRYASRLS